jgi:hypothetical protein
MTNHVPVVGVPIAVAFLAYALYSQNIGMQKSSLVALVLISMFAIPVFLTGEPTEKVIENLPGVSESLIDPHEDAATLALVLTLIVGASALVGFLVPRTAKAFSYLTTGTLVLGVIATISLAYAANLGGQIRHSEIRSQGEAVPSAPERPGS